MAIDRFQSVSPCRVLVFTSPKAGSGKHREQIPRLMDLLETAGVRPVLVHSRDELKRELSVEGCETVVVAAGGDGTISLAASIASPATLIVPMPLGTENLLARQFGHSAMAESVVQTIRQGAIQPLDSGIANGSPFLIMTSCGFDAEVVRGMHLTRRGHIRRLSYFTPIVRALRHYKFPPITVRVDDGETLSGGWAMVFNLPRYGGGLKIEPEAVGNDGQLDVIVFQGRSWLSGLKYVLGIWLGRHLRFRDVVRCRGRVVEITASTPVPYQTDGDYAGQLPLAIKVQPGRLRLLLPPESQGGLPESS